MKEEIEKLFKETEHILKNELVKRSSGVAKAAIEDGFKLTDEEVINATVEAFVELVKIYNEQEPVTKEELNLQGDIGMSKEQYQKMSYVLTNPKYLEKVLKEDGLEKQILKEYRQTERNNMSFKDKIIDSLKGIIKKPKRQVNSLTKQAAVQTEINRNYSKGIFK